MSDIQVPLDDLKKAYSILSDFQDRVYVPNHQRIRDFFQALVRTAYDNFNAKVVTAWAYNSQTDTLVLQASYPKRDETDGEFSIVAASTFTGIAIEKGKITTRNDLGNKYSGRMFASPKLLKKFNLKSMISLPIKRLSNQNLISFIINIYFDDDYVPSCPLNDSEMKRLVGNLELSLDYLMTQKYKRISESALKNIPNMRGVQSLFESIVEPLKNLIGSDNASIYRWDKKNRIFQNEGSTTNDFPKTISRDTIISSINWKDSLNGEVIYNNCLWNKGTFVFKTKASLKQETNSESFCTILNPLAAVPIMSISNEVLGLLICKDPINYSNFSGSFSSLDVRTIEKLSQIIAPYFENFLRLKEHSTLSKVVDKISNSMPQPGQLDSYLNDIIEQVTDSLKAEIGSIYLFNESDNKLVMRAGSGSNKSLIYKANYCLEDGLTGAVAKNNSIINLKTKEDVISHPNYLGKHDEEIYKASSEKSCRNFLGVPISIKDKVVGVLKIANLRSDEDHPNTYFTDEDEQAIKVIACFIAYSVELEKKWKQFNLLVRETNNIQNASIQEDAINLAMVAIESAGYRNSVISLYENDSGLIKGFLSTGDWATIEDKISIHYESESIMAEILKENQPRLIDYTNKAISSETFFQDFKILSQYVLPLRLEDEMLGILQVDMGGASTIDINDELILNAFAKHLSITISRLRSIKQFSEMTDKVMSSSRFIVAETLSSLAVHSTRHQLSQILKEINQQVEQKNIRENKLLNDTFRTWKDRLRKLNLDLSDALRFVKAKSTTGSESVGNIHKHIQSAIKMWYGHIKEKNCRISIDFDATESNCEISSHAIHEILSVLIVNAVQAHAKTIKIKTKNFSDIVVNKKILIRKAITIIFTDDGDGIFIDNPEVIFNPDYSTKPDKYGTGLGLFIARKIARNSGGELEVNIHKPNTKGVTFTLTLPTNA